MKPFITKLALFSLLLVICLCSIYASLYTHIKKEHIINTTLKKNIHTVSISDSHTQTLLNPTYLTNFANRSHSGAPLKSHLVKLQSLIQYNPNQIKQVFIDVHPRNIVEHNFLPDSKSEDSLLYVFYNALHKEKPILKYNTVIKTLNPYIYNILFKYKSKKIHFIGAFSHRTGQLYLSNTNRVLRLENSIVTSFNKSQISSINLNSIVLVKNMIEIAKKNNIQPILITTPYHKELRQRLSPELIDKFEFLIHNLSEESDIPWLNYYSYEFEDAMWGDPTHVNIYATPKFAKQLNLDLKQHGLIPLE